MENRGFVSKKTFSVRAAKPKRNNKWGDSDKLNFDLLDVLGEVAYRFCDKKLPNASDFYALIKSVSAEANENDSSGTKRAGGQNDSNQKKKQKLSDNTNLASSASSSNGLTYNGDSQSLDNSIAKFIQCIRAAYADASILILKYLQYFLNVRWLSLICLNEWLIFDSFFCPAPPRRMVDKLSASLITCNG